MNLNKIKLENERIWSCWTSSSESSLSFQLPGKQPITQHTISNKKISRTFCWGGCWVAGDYREILNHSASLLIFFKWKRDKKDKVLSFPRMKTPNTLEGPETCTKRHPGVFGVVHCSRHYESGPILLFPWQSSSLFIEGDKRKDISPGSMLGSIKRHLLFSSKFLKKHRENLVFET